MSNCNSEDLLTVFSELNVSLANLDANIIKAWFDTDDVDLKNLLDWMCTSLSKDNYLSPLEYAEYSKLDTPLVGDKYEREVKNIDERCPGIFEADELAFEIELLEDELDLAVEEDKHLEELIKINENLQRELAKELDVVSTEQIKTALKLKSAQELCGSLGEKLDETNGKIHKQLVKYGSNLYDFKNGCVSNFINNMDTQELRDSFNNITSFLIPLLDEFHVEDPNVTLTNVGISTLNANDSVTNTLDAMKTRILQSYRNYAIVKIETEKARKTLDQLNKTDVSSVLLLKEDAYAQMRREEKTERKHGLCGMLDEGLTSWAEEQVTQTKLKYARKELEEYRSKLEKLKQIEDSVLKLLSQYLLLDALYVQEKEDIDDSDQFFRKILDYIRKDLRDVTMRTEKMKKIVEEQENYEARFKLIESIARILTNGREFDLGRSLEIVCEFKNELDALQIKLFTTDFCDHKQTVRELQKNVNILRSFLVCGPTCRIVVVPPELQTILAVTEENLKKQEASVRTAVKIYASTKITDKWENYRRLLWTYFLTDPKKMFLVLAEVEEESKKKNTGEAKEML